MIKVKDIMCEHPIKIRESVPLGQVVHLMLRYQVHGILVVADGNEEELTGIFTMTDLLRIMDTVLAGGKQRSSQLKKISSFPLGKVAKKRVITLQKEDRVVKAIATMHKKQVHTIPIMDGETLVGVLGRHDILNVAFNSLGE
ncbi:MAG: CBS domain-containing protein [Candidatus Omnitrophica bacterium]|nr:CBS domain-containing protein [Candidatus Omnitrophota bacterium]